MWELRGGMGNQPFFSALPFYIPLTPFLPSLFSIPIPLRSLACDLQIMRAEGKLAERCHAYSVLVCM